MQDQAEWDKTAEYRERLENEKAIEDWRRLVSSAGCLINLWIMVTIVAIVWFVVWSMTSGSWIYRGGGLW